MIICRARRRSRSYTGGSLLVTMLRLREVRERTRFALVWLLICAVPAWLWLGSMDTVYIPGRTDVVIDPHARAHHVATHPWAFATVVWSSIRYSAGYLSRSFVGLLGWNETFPPEWYVRVFCAALLLCLLFEARKATMLHWPLRLIMCATGVAAGLLVFAAQYASWNAPGSSDLIIGGVVGRYFCPIAPCFVLSFPTLPWPKVSDIVVATAGTAFATLGAGVCVWEIVNRY